MIDEADVVDLPADKEAAFLKLARTARTKFRAAAEEHLERGIPLPSSVQRDYVNKVYPAAQECGIAELTGWNFRGAMEAQEFLDDVDAVISRLTIRRALRKNDYTVAFDPATKVKLRHYLDQIRDIVDKSSDTMWKKDALYEKIAALVDEIDRERTTYEKLTVLGVEAAGTAAEIWEKIEPIYNAMLRTVGLAKAQEETQARLPAPKTKRQIPPPNKETAFDKKLDEEIPF